MGPDMILVEPEVGSAPAGEQGPLQRDRSGRVCSRPGCGKALIGRQTDWCSETCRWKVWDAKNPRQRALPLDPPAEPLIQPRDQRVPKVRRRGFSYQAHLLLARLEEGPCANVEMARMFPPATAWRSRLSDARWELRRRFGLRDTEDPIPGYDCGGGLIWHWIAL